MEVTLIEYDDNGLPLTGYLATPSRPGRVPGVLVAHEAAGMNDNIKTRAAKLADAGYAAFALDMFGVEGLSREEGEARVGELMDTPGLMVQRATAALDTLIAQPAVDQTRLAAVGFCLGGVIALELARAGAPILCAAGFHPGFVRPAGSADEPVTAKILLMAGADDPYATEHLRADITSELSAKGADWQLHLFSGVGHTFTDPTIDALNRPGFAYNADADRRSWNMMLGLLAECFEAADGAPTRASSPQ